MGAVPEEKVLDWVRRESRRLVNPRRVWLFGSRARRDHHDRSDYDFALEVDEAILAYGIAQLSALVDEDGPTLCGIDLVDLSSPILPELREAIYREGVLIDERNT